MSYVHDILNPGSNQAGIELPEVISIRNMKLRVLDTARCS